MNGKNARNEEVLFWYEVNNTYYGRIFDSKIEMEHRDMKALKNEAHIKCKERFGVDNYELILNPEE